MPSSPLRLALTLSICSPPRCDWQVSATPTGCFKLHNFNVWKTVEGGVHFERNLISVVVSDVFSSDNSVGILIMPAGGRQNTQVRPIGWGERVYTYRADGESGQPNTRVRRLEYCLRVSNK